MTEDKKRGTNDPSKQTPETSDPDHADSPSLASRIQNSATGLAKNAFSAQSASADTALLANSGKAGPARSSSSAAEQYRDMVGAGSSTAQGTERTINAETFRSSTEQGGGFEIPGLTRRKGLDGSLMDGGKEKGKAKEVGNARSGATPAQVNLLPTDGSAVMSLLDDQTFDPSFPPSADEPFEMIDTELSYPPLTQEEIQIIDSFRRHMAPSNDAPFTHRLAPASLVPDIDTILDSAAPQTDSEATLLRDNVLASLPGSEDWVPVEERYHDEVWGYLKPTLEAARKEMEEAKDEPRKEDGPAVTRLKTVLGHMRAKL
ncbi:hypothetical protein BDV25DRAFT_130152 [Aspergillus avenaceus]|uniref:Uncharacterized protein n=1 Tax=Aspergillus avenaceus TaxID=36643 RepID=A0A5N6TTQ6_ASPAV|nr:hypothetical protein BDV25DRAFT_130152 [Aspergillus avenaceus]